MRQAAAPPTVAQPRLTPVAGHALMVEFDDVISEAGHDAVLRLDQALGARPCPGLREAVPAYVSLLVAFDPLATNHHQVARHVRALLVRAPDPKADAAVHDIAVCYDEDLAPDLAEVARQCGLSSDAVIRAHLGGQYRVFMYGFAPGYAYLGGVPDPIRLDRKPSPRRDVPAGSVLIAGPQCLISTLQMPTGWWIIGRSDAHILRDDPERPFLFDTGDRVRFRRVRREALGSGDAR